MQVKVPATPPDSTGWVASWGLAANVAAALLSYLLHLVVGRFMSPESYSETLSLLSVYMMVLMPATPFLLVVTRRVAEERARGNGAGVHALLRGLTVRIGVVGGGALVVAWVAREPLAAWLSVSASALPLFVLGVVTSLLCSVAQAALLGLFRWRAALGLPVILGIARLTLSILFVWAYDAATGMFVAIALSTSVCFAGAYVLTVRELPAATTYRPLGLGEIAMAASINGAFWFLVHVDTVYVNRELPQLVDQGYAAAAVLARPIVYFSAGVNQALFPFLAVAATRETRRHVLTRMFATAALLSIVGLVALWASPEWLLALTFGPAYVEAARLLPAVGSMLAPLSLVNVFLYDALARQDAVVARSFIVIAVTAGAVLALVTPMLGGLIGVLAGSAAVAIVIGARRMWPTLQ